MTHGHRGFEHCGGSVWRTGMADSTAPTRKAAQVLVGTCTTQWADYLAWRVPDSNRATPSMRSRMKSTGAAVFPRSTRSGCVLSTSQVTVDTAMLRERFITGLFRCVLDPLIGVGSTSGVVRHWVVLAGRWLSTRHDTCKVPISGTESTGSCVVGRSSGCRGGLAQWGTQYRQLGSEIGPPGNGGAGTGDIGIVDRDVTG